MSKYTRVERVQILQRVGARRLGIYFMGGGGGSGLILDIKKRCEVEILGIIFNYGSAAIIRRVFVCTCVRVHCPSLF